MCALVTGVQTCALPIWAFGSTGSPLYRAVVAINQGVAGIVAQASGSAAATDRTFDAFLPKAGIQMAWTPNLKTGFTVQRGYRSGGSSGNIARSATFSYDPEFTWNYELSLRSAWRSEEHTSELQSHMRMSYGVLRRTHKHK